MELSYKSGKLRKAFENRKAAFRLWGPENGKLLMRRHEQMRAAETLHDFQQLPQVRCHALTGNRRGQLACDGKHPFRLVFEIDHDPVPVFADGGVDWKKITGIRIIEVTDYHGE